MLEKIKQLIDKILSFISNMFKAGSNNKFADTIKDNKLVEINNDNSSKLLQQYFYVGVLPNINVDDAIKHSFAVGNENAKLVGVDVEKLLTSNNFSNESVRAKLANPEILYTIAKANEIAYKNSDIDKRKMLSDLIFQKIKENVDSESSIILSLAIQEMDILNINHIKALAFLYIIKSNYLKEYTTDDLKDFTNRVFVKLLDFKNSNAKNVGKFLSSTRTISDAHLGWGIDSYLPQILIPSNDKTKIIDKEFIYISQIWENLGYTGVYITPVGKYIAKTYLFNSYGITIEDKEINENSTKDLSDDVSAKELVDAFANANITTWEEIKTDDQNA